jgi:arginine-tRNA-protein transferase
MKRDKDNTFLFREEFVCPYFTDNRLAKIEYMLPSEQDIRDFHRFLARGFRRLDTVFYRNICAECSSCIPIRLSVGAFVPSRSQKKAEGENKDLRVVVMTSPVITREKIRLYDKYVSTKHGKPCDAAGQDTGKILQMLHCGFERTIEMDYYLGERLIGVGIVDEAKDSLSSNYFYYDPDLLNRRPGIFSIMQEIELARKMKKRYYYLGFYIAETDKMSYKKYFRPNQILRKGRWVPFLGSPSGTELSSHRKR